MAGMFSKVVRKWNRRPFPVSLLELRQCRISYSQYGEDLFLTHLLGYECERGFYLDVGCFHPVTYSNTYIFYRRGWRGVCIDANPDWSAAWARYRPRDRFVNAAIAPEPAAMVYVRDRRYPAMNRLLTENALAQTPLPPERFSTQRVTAAPLPEVLRHHGVPRDFELLSMDCEGMDLAIIAATGFDEYRPRVVCVEDHQTSGRSDLQALIESRGYTLRAALGISKIFQRN
jgi:FkbM family methyltransferase